MGSPGEVTDGVLPDVHELGFEELGREDRSALDHVLAVLLGKQDDVHYGFQAVI